MGIDIYAKWEKQTEEEEKAQWTGFDITAGKFGYLREAYHGGPYVTHFLVDEAFEKGEAKIPAKTLRERLPMAVLLSMIRHKNVYEKGNDKTEQTMESLPNALKQVFEVEVNDKSHVELSKKIGDDAIETVKILIENKSLPDYALSFVEFVELCERKEKETGEPCLIIASY